jgi:hypothetical protein
MVKAPARKKNRYMRRRGRRPQLTQQKKTADDDDGTTVMYRDGVFALHLCAEPSPQMILSVVANAGMGKRRVEGRLTAPGVMMRSITN